jgi:hypothetical protein
LSDFKDKTPDEKPDATTPDPFTLDKETLQDLDPKGDAEGVRGGLRPQTTIEKPPTDTYYLSCI